MGALSRVSIYHPEKDTADSFRFFARLIQLGRYVLASALQSCAIPEFASIEL